MSSDKWFRQPINYFSILKTDLQDLTQASKIFNRPLQYYGEAEANKFKGMSGVDPKELRKVMNKHRITETKAPAWWSGPRGKAIAGSYAGVLARSAYRRLSHRYGGK